jgi:hypothetical protein
VKTHYQLLGVEANAEADEVKRAFRREIARYHPDKVQHLGHEFQEIAAVRAAELTEAYRVLMDVELRRKYDEALDAGGDHEPPVAPPPPRAEPPPRPHAPPEPEAPPASRVDRRFQQERATTGDVVRKAALAKMRSAVAGVSENASQQAIGGFDAAYVIKPRKSLFKKAQPAIRLLVRFVPQVDGPAVDEAWPLASRAGPFDGVSCVLLLGTGIAPARELGAAISEQRRRTRSGAPVMVPIDVRDWEALFPPEVPDLVRQVVQRLRTGFL